MSKKKKPAPKKPAPKKAAPKPAPKKKPSTTRSTPKKAPAKPVARSPKKKAPKAAPPVKAVRKDARGRFYDVGSGRPIKAERAKRFKTFFDPSGRRRATKGGTFVGGPSLAPTARAKRRKGLKTAFAPAEPRERAKRQRKLLGGAIPSVVMRVNPNVLRGIPGARADELARMFGVDLRTTGDFAALIEAQGRELGRASFTVEDPIGTREDRTILRGIEGASRRALAGVRPGLVAVTTNVTADGRELPAQTVIVRAEERSEFVGGVMASVFTSLGDAGLDASDGNEDVADPVDELEVEIVVYELE